MKRSERIRATATERSRNAVEEYFKLKDRLIFGEPEAQQAPVRKTGGGKKKRGGGFPPRYGVKIQPYSVGLLPGEKDLVMRFLQILRDYKYGETDAK